MKRFYADYAMLIKEDRILHQWRFPLVASLKQAHINLDEYNDEDYVNFDMIDEAEAWRVREVLTEMTNQPSAK